MSDEAIRTDYEVLFQKGLDQLQVKYQINKIYCFKCQKVFNWTRSAMPEKCGIGRHQWTEPGQFARPDFLIYSNDDEPVGVVRIDGPVHDRVRQKAKDKFQVKSFLDSGIKVFIVRNEHLLGAQHNMNKKRKSTWFPVRFPDWHYMSLALFIVLATQHDEYYEKYISDKDVRYYLGI